MTTTMAVAMAMARSTTARTTRAVDPKELQQSNQSQETQQGGQKENEWCSKKSPTTHFDLSRAAVIAGLRQAVQRTAAMHDTAVMIVRGQVVRGQVSCRVVWCGVVEVRAVVVLVLVLMLVLETIR
jgi:hypothetical protein